MKLVRFFISIEDDLGPRLSPRNIDVDATPVVNIDGLFSAYVDAGLGYVALIRPKYSSESWLLHADNPNSKCRTLGKVLISLPQDERWIDLVNGKRKEYRNKEN